MSSRMRKTRSETRNRRSHHGLESPRFSVCENCEKHKIRHKVCSHCGQYRGRQVVDVVAQQKRKEERKKRKLRELGKDPSAAEEKGTEEAAQEPAEPKVPLSPEELSKKQ